MALIISEGSTPDFKPIAMACAVPGDIQTYQQIVDELDLGRGAKGSKIKAEIGKIVDDPLDFGCGSPIAGQIDDALALRHHARRSAHFTVEKNNPLCGQRSNVAFLHRYGMRAELDHDLAWSRGVDETIRAHHDFLKRFVAWKACENEIRLRPDIRRRFRWNAANLRKIGQELRR